MNNKKIYLVTDPDDNREVFDTEIAAKKYIIQQARKCNALDGDYINYVKNIMKDDPDSAPSSYNDFINKLIQSDDFSDDYEYFIEDFIVKTEKDIDI